MTNPTTRPAHIQIGDTKYDLNFIASLLTGSSKESNAKVVQQPEEKEREDVGEFYLISRDFFRVDLDEFTDKYPFISAVATVALGFFALMNVFSISLTNIATGCFLGILSYGLFSSLKKQESLLSKIWTNALNATKVPEDEEDEEPTPTEKLAVKNQK